MAAALLAGCAAPRRQQAVPEFRDEVLARVADLQDTWPDWLALLQASDVVEGVFWVDDPAAIQSKPEQYLAARVESPRVLLGRPVTDARKFIVFNTTIRRWGYWPVYLSDLQESNGKPCVVFLHVHGKHVVNSREGKVKPIMPLSDLAPRKSQLESFLYLARLDPVQVAHLVSKPDSRVDDIVQKARVATGNINAVQSCYDDLRAMGADALPGILHAMTEVMLNPKANSLLEIGGVSLRPPGSDSNEPSVRADDIFELLHLAASGSFDLTLPPYDDPEGRWARIRVIALYLLAREVPLPTLRGSARGCSANTLGSRRRAARACRSGTAPASGRVTGDLAALGLVGGPSDPGAVGGGAGRRHIRRRATPMRQVRSQVASTEVVLEKGPASWQHAAAVPGVCRHSHARCAGPRRLTRRSGPSPVARLCVQGGQHAVRGIPRRQRSLQPTLPATALGKARACISAGAAKPGAPWHR